MHRETAIHPLPSPSDVTILIALPEADSTRDGLLLELLLAEAGLPQLTIVTTTSELAVLDLIRRGGLDVVLLKAQLDSEAGLARLRRITHADPRVAVVAFTDAGDRRLAWTAVEEGAEDCLLRSEMSSAVLLRSIRYAIERQRSATTLRRLERYDPLTGLLNQRSLLELLQRLLARAQNGGGQFAVLVFEQSSPRQGLRRYGQLFFEELSIALARRLEQTARPGDSLARLDSDEFVLVLQALHRRDEAKTAARRISEQLSRPLTVRDQVLELGFRQGMSWSQGSFDGPYDLLGAAVLDLKCS